MEPRLFLAKAGAELLNQLRHRFQTRKQFPKKAFEVAKLFVMLQLDSRAEAGEEFGSETYKNPDPISLRRVWLRDLQKPRSYKPEKSLAPRLTKTQIL